MRKKVGEEEDEEDKEREKQKRLKLNSFGGFEKVMSYNFIDEKRKQLENKH